MTHGSLVRIFRKNKRNENEKNHTMGDKNAGSG